jgi:hypothetical protein
MSGRIVEDEAAGARGRTWGSNQPEEGSERRRASPFVEATLIRAEQSLEAEARTCGSRATGEHERG